MSDTSAYAPFATSYGQTTPYLTVNEYKTAPTAIDTSNLLPGGDTGSQDIALQEAIARASSLIDQECLGAYGTLNASLNTENARIWANNKGQMVVNTLYWPVLEVRSFAFGLTPSGLSSVTPAGNVWVEQAGFVVQPSGAVGLGLNGLVGVNPRGEYFCTWEYVNGWPNTPLVEGTAAGDTTILPTSIVGIYPGSRLRVVDLPNDENVTVDASYVPGSTSVPLTAPLLYDHFAGAVVTNLPAAAKQAAISLTTCLVKTRGSGALVADDMGGVTKIASGDPQGAAADLAMAMRSVRALRANFVGY